MKESSYEKTKAQRLLAKSVPLANIHQQTEDNTAVTKSSLSNLQASGTQQTIPVCLIIRFALLQKNGEIRSFRLDLILAHPSLSKCRHWIT